MSKFDSFIEAAQEKSGKAPVKAKQGSDRMPAKVAAKDNGERRAAKRDNPDYKQALAYVRRDTHKRVMVRLAAEELQFSDLVETLLSEWLDS